MLPRMLLLFSLYLLGLEVVHPKETAGTFRGDEADAGGINAAILGIKGMNEL
jgi:hypothetical protein